MIIFHIHSVIACSAKQQGTKNRVTCLAAKGFICHISTSIW
jgi:hypothetical protein